MSYAMTLKEKKIQLYQFYKPLCSPMTPRIALILRLKSDKPADLKERGFFSLPFCFHFGRNLKEENICSKKKGNSVNQSQPLGCYFRAVWLSAFPSPVIPHFLLPSCKKIICLGIWYQSLLTKKQIGSKHVRGLAQCFKHCEFRRSALQLCSRFSG